VKDGTICGAEFQNGTRGLKALPFLHAQLGPERAALPRDYRRRLFIARIAGVSDRLLLRGKWEEVSGRTWKDARNERGEPPKSAEEERAFKARVKRLTKRTGFSPLWWLVEERRFSAAR
jgi:hypothetical protein